MVRVRGIDAEAGSGSITATATLTASGSGEEPEPSFWSDTFDYDGTPEAGWVAETGSWSSVGDPWFVMDNTDGNGVLLRDTATGDHKITSNVRIGAVSIPTQIFGVVARATDEDNLIGWEIVRSATENKTVLYVRIAGVDTELASVPSFWDYGDEPELVLSVHGREVIGYVNGVAWAAELLTSGQASSLTGTKAGLVQFTGRSSWLDAAAAANDPVEATAANTGIRVAEGSLTPLAATSISPGVVYTERLITGTWWLDAGTDAGYYKLVDCKFESTPHFDGKGADVSIDLLHCEGTEHVYLSFNPNPGPTLRETGCKWTAGGITGGMASSVGEIEHSGTNRDCPILVCDTYNYMYHNDAGGAHTEAMALFGVHAEGMRFVRSTYVQEGPTLPPTATATINLHGANTVMSNCNHIWDNGVGSPWCVYYEGADNVAYRSRIWGNGSGGGYVYPSSSPAATYVECRDYNTDDLLDLP